MLLDNSKDSHLLLTGHDHHYWNADMIRLFQDKFNTKIDVIGKDRVFDTKGFQWVFFKVILKIGFSGSGMDYTYFDLYTMNLYHRGTQRITELHKRNTQWFLVSLRGPLCKFRISLPL